jgi:hypothetical protein
MRTELISSRSLVVHWSISRFFMKLSVMDVVHIAAKTWSVPSAVVTLRARPNALRFAASSTQETLG